MRRLNAPLVEDGTMAVSNRSIDPSIDRCRRGGRFPAKLGRIIFESIVVEFSTVETWVPPIAFLLL